MRYFKKKYVFIKKNKKQTTHAEMLKYTGVKM